MPTAFPLLTVHTLTALPSHNLNRDDTGAPKQVLEGGATRSRLSSQSLKRAAREAFERAEATGSVRTRLAIPTIVDAVADARGHLTSAERTKITRQVTTRVNALTQSDTDGAETKDTDATAKKDTMVWLSAQELSSFVRAVSAGLDTELVPATSTDSLAIAAFGRMFAAAPHLSLPASVSVGDAVTTHAATIDMDWFAAVDDAETRHAGGGHLGYALRTSGVYYRSFTIDRAQLHRNFDGDLSRGEHDDALRQFVRHLTLTLPNGRNAGTAAKTLPALVIAEEQAHRVVYDFHEPIRDNGDGFLAPSITALEDKRAAARAFDPTLFGADVTTGTATSTPFTDYLEFILDRLR
jgi:CRISPR system Cascade subunit CasC